MTLRLNTTSKNILKSCAFAVLLAGLSACEPSGAQTEPAPKTIRPVKAIELSESHGQTRLNLPGAAKAQKETDLSFRVGGPLIQLKVDTGQQVKKGQVLARIDARDFKIRIKTCRAGLASAKAQLQEARLQYKRYSKLVKYKAVARAEYDRIKALYEMALAQKQSREKALEDAQNALVDTVLKAPFSGCINQKFVDNHETVQPGQPIASLVDLKNMEVRLSLSEDLLPLIKRFSSFSCSFDALPGQLFAARFKEAGKKSDPASRTYPLLLALDKKAATLVRPGMSAEVFIQLAPQPFSKSFVVPLSALVNRGGQNSYVWVVGSKPGKPRLTSVTILSLKQKGAEIKGELSPGQWVVTAGATSIDKNQEVRLFKEPSKTNIGKEM
jgi:RND family efflux transporter MFP subunit